MSPTMRSILNYRGAILFALMQAAPVDVEVKDNGRFALAFGISGDRYLQETFTCDGAVLDSREVTSRTMSGSVNIPLRGSWSLEVFGGETKSDDPVCADAACSLPPAFKGGFGGMRFRIETGDASLSIGAASLPDVEIDYVNSTHDVTREITPTMQLRIGSIAPGRRHFRAEIAGIPTPGSLPMTTFGFGFTGKQPTDPNGFLGLAIPPYSAAENGSLLLRGELAIPAGRWASLNFGVAGNTKIFSGQAGLRFQSARSRSAAASVP